MVHIMMRVFRHLSTNYQIVITNNTIHIVFAALKDKKLDQMIAKLDQIADELSFVIFDFPRAAEANDLLCIKSFKK